MLVTVTGQMLFLDFQSWKVTIVSMPGLSGPTRRPFVRKPTRVVVKKGGER